MVLLISAGITTLLGSLLMKRVFSMLDFTVQGPKGVMVPCSGGTVIFLGIFAGYLTGLLSGRLSFFKFIFFMVLLFLVYSIGMLGDIYGESIRKFLGKIPRINAGILAFLCKFLFYFALSGYCYFYFVEEYFLLKAILTAALTSFFNSAGKREIGVFKPYYFFFMMLSLSTLRWNRELYLISFTVISVYCCFERRNFSTLGEGGANLAGFSSGLMVTEAVSTNFIHIVVILSGIIAFQVITQLKNRKKDLYLSTLCKFIEKVVFKSREEGEKIR